MALYDFGRPITLDWKGLRSTQWESIRPILPARKRPWRRRLRKGGRPRRDDRACFEALIWLVLTDGTWSRIPARFAKWRTVQRRVREWRRGGRLEKLWRAYLLTLGYDDRRRVERALGLTGSRRRADWRLELDLASVREAYRRPSLKALEILPKRLAWRFDPIRTKLEALPS